MTNLTNFNDFALNTEETTNVNGGCRRRRRSSCYSSCKTSYSGCQTNYNTCEPVEATPVEIAPVEIAPEVIATPVIENRAPLAGIAGA